MSAYRLLLRKTEVFGKRHGVKALSPVAMFALAPSLQLLMHTRISVGCWPLLLDWGRVISE